MPPATRSKQLVSAKPQATQRRLSRRSLSNLFVRVATGMAALPFILIMIFLGGWFVTVPIGILMAIGILEFFFMEQSHGEHNHAPIGVVAAILVLLAFHLEWAWLWQVAVLMTISVTFLLEFRYQQHLADSVKRSMMAMGGIFYIAFPMACLVAIRHAPSGLHWFFAFIYTTWGTDTFAYLVGNMFGKHKLAPDLSPGKTIEGAIGGIVAGALLPLAVLYQGQIPITSATVLLFAITPIAATLGDLFESAVKRFFKAKDSHMPGFNLLPGHGGVLDRIDSTLWVATVMYAYLLFTGDLTLLW